MTSLEKLNTLNKDSNLLHKLPENRNGNLSLNSLTLLSDVSSEKIIKRNFLYGNRKSAYKSFLREYTKKTSVHGLNYIFEIHRPFYEKLYWIIAILISLYCVIYYMWKTYAKWSYTPIILGFDETLVKIHTIPFPTVTICPEIQRELSVFNFPQVSNLIWSEIEEYTNFENRNNFSDNELQQFLSTLQTCDREVIDKFAPYMPTDNRSVNIAENLLDMITDAHLPKDMCGWNGEFVYGCSMMKTVITDEGVCYQFNSLQRHDMFKNPDYMAYRDDAVMNFNVTGNWSLDHGYRGQGVNAYPQRSISVSIGRSFSVLLDTFDENNDYVCKDFKQGFKIFLNSPDSMTLTTNNYILVPKSHEVMLTVIPQYIKADEDLLNFEPEKRQCYFNNERNLRFFKIYTQNNCQTECLTNYTIAKCGCTKFWMPKPLDIPVCDLSKVTCYTNAADELNVIIANQTVRKMKDSTVKIMCDCKPGCNSLEYNYEITRAYLDAEGTVMSLRESYDNHAFLISRLIVHYKESHFTAIKRTAMYNRTQLIANCGAIFALFMGVSLLSFIEFIYFFTLRLFSNYRKRKFLQKKLNQVEIEI